MTNQDKEKIIDRFWEMTNLERHEFEKFVDQLFENCTVEINDLTCEQAMKIVLLAVGCITISKEVATGNYAFKKEELELLQQTIKAEGLAN